MGASASTPSASAIDVRRLLNKYEKLKNCVAQSGVELDRILDSRVKGRNMRDYSMTLNCAAAVEEEAPLDLLTEVSKMNLLLEKCIKDSAKIQGLINKSPLPQHEKVRLMGILLNANKMCDLAHKAKKANNMEAAIDHGRAANAQLKEALRNFGEAMERFRAPAHPAAYANKPLPDLPPPPLPPRDVPRPPPPRPHLGGWEHISRTLFIIILVAVIVLIFYVTILSPRYYRNHAR